MQRGLLLGTFALALAACAGDDDVAVTTAAVSSSDLTIVNPNPVGSGQFGGAVALRGNDLLVGAPRNTAGVTANAGVVYVFNSDTGALSATIPNPDAGAGDRFGQTIAVFSDGSFAVGAPLDNPTIATISYTDAGSVYIFGSDNTLQRTIHSGNATLTHNEEFGASLAAVSTTELVVGASFDLLGGVVGSGSVWVVNPSTGAINLEIDNPVPGPSTNDNFGASVAVRGSTIYVGAPSDDTTATNAGQVYEFSDTSSTVTAQLAPPDGASAGGNLFGTAIAVASSTRVLVDAAGYKVGANLAVGQIYGYDAGNALVATIPNPAPAANDNFGSVLIPLSSTMALAGTPLDDGTATDTGSISFISLASGTVARTIALPVAATTSDKYGSALAAAGSAVIVGSQGFDSGASTDAGRVFLIAPPIANGQTVSTAEDTALPITLTGTDPQGDALTFTPGTPAHGTITGTSPSFTYTPAADYNGPDSFAFTASDGGMTSSAATVSITVSAVNDAPRPDPLNLSTAEDTNLPFTLTGVDPEADTFTFDVPDSPSHGALILGALPDVVYVPAPDYNGPDSFQVTATDTNNATSAPVTISITVTAVNDTPVANAQSVGLNEDTPTPITLTATDADGDSLTYQVVAGPGPQHGTLSGTAPDLTYTPDPNYNGPDQFFFTATDPSNATSPSAKITIDVTPVNDAPVATPQSVSTAEDTALPITLAGTDVEGDTLSFTVATPPSHGSLSGTAPELTYTPVGDYHGPDSFTFTAFDGAATSTAATISITVTAVNDAPVADAQSVTTAEDTALPLTLTASDVDGDTLAYSVTAGPTHGSLSGTAPDLTYTPNPNYHGPDALTFQVSDGTATDSATISITVTSVNDAPTANAQIVTTSEDTALPITLTGSDVDGDTMTFAIATSPSHGTLSGTAPSVTYTPNPNFNGTDQFTFTVSDGLATSAPAFVSIAISPVNDPPTANPQSVSTAEDTALPITLTSTDPDGGTITYAVVAAPSHGALTGTAPNLTYTPDADYHGPDSFTFTADDGQATSGPATVSITVTAVNDPPVADPQTLSVNQGASLPITLTGSDVDGDTLTFTATAASHGTLNGNPPTLTYTPASGYAGADSIAVTAHDATSASAPATISITVDNVAPVLTSALVDDVTIFEGESVNFTAVATDAGGDTLTYAWNFGDGNNGAGASVSHTYAQDGVYTATVTVSDGHGGSDQMTTLPIQVANVPPTVDSLTVPSLSEGSPGTFVATASDPGIDDTLAYSWSWGDGSADSTGASAAHTYADDEGGPFLVTLTVSDSDGGVTTATRSAVVTNVNPTPVNPGTTHVTIGDTLTLDFSASDPGGAGDPLTWANVAMPSGAAVTSAGHFTFATSATGTFSVGVEVDDDDGGFARMSFAVVVDGVNPPDAGVPDAAVPDAAPDDAAPADAATPDAEPDATVGPDGGTDTTQPGGCCSTGGGGAAGGPLLLGLAVALGLRRRGRTGA